MNEKQQDIISIARSWVGTPFVYQGNVKGVGADCAALVKEIYLKHTAFSSSHDYITYGFLPNFGRVVDMLREYSTRVTTPEPADIVLYNVRGSPHFAVLTDTGTIVHSHIKTRKYVEVTFVDSKLIFGYYRV